MPFDLFCRLHRVTQHNAQVLAEQIAEHRFPKQNAGGNYLKSSVPGTYQNDPKCVGLLPMAT